ncbi:unnamed protein product, partial [Closterium sp. NIES-54]
AKDAEEEEEEVQQVSERASALPSRTTSAPRIRVTLHQRQGLHVPATEEEGRGKRIIQAPNRLTYDALAGAALIVRDDEERDYEECAFAFFSPKEMPREPATLKEALESSDAEDWKKAIESELKSIEENGTWELVELPEGRKAITSKWLFKIKSDADGKIKRYKYMLVAKGYQQKEKVDYMELFAPVLKSKTLRTLLAGAAIQGWVVKQMDMRTAFLNGVLEEEIFMAQPEGCMEEIGFTPSTTDHSLFMLGEGEQSSFMVVYVDDILIFSPSSDLVKKVMLNLQDKFKCKALGDVNFYLGLHIERDVEKRCMRVHQLKYLEALAANFGQIEGHVATTFPSGLKCVKGLEEESVGEEERRRFHSLVGSLVLAKYLGQTPTVGLQYSAAAQRRQKGADGVEPKRFFLTAFSDASYASEPEDMTTVGGLICCDGGGPTAWESKKQVDQALSSVESEYMALFRAVREIVWQRRLLAELGEEQQEPTPLYCDSQGAIALAKNPVLHGLTKHMSMKWHWTRSMVAAGEVELHYVKTTRQPADMLTKRLVEQQHWKLLALDSVLLGAGWKKSQVDTALYFKGYADKLRRRFIDEEKTGRTLKTPVLVDAYAELMFDDEEAQERKEEEYRQKVGSLQFMAAKTRPDIAFARRKLGSGPTVRSDQHWREVDRCLAYLASTCDTALEFGGAPESLKLVGYVDAVDAGDTQNRTSTGGYVFVYGGSAVSWSSQRIKCATLSSTELEYVAATEAGKEGHRLRFFLAEFRQLDARTPIILWVDNKSAIMVAKGMGLTSNLKHMDRRQAWLQDMVKRGKFTLKYIPTTEQPADFLTKALHYPAFNWCSVAIGQVRLADVGDGDDDVQQ